MKKLKQIQKIQPTIFNSYEEAWRESDIEIPVFPIIQERKIIGYRVWLEEDKNYLCNCLAEELYWDSFDSIDENRIKNKYNWPFWVISEVCYNIQLIEEKYKEY